MGEYSSTECFLRGNTEETVMKLYIRNGISNEKDQQERLCKSETGKRADMWVLLVFRGRVSALRAFLTKRAEVKQHNSR